MKIIIIAAAVYYLLGTIWLMNILFNPCFKLALVHKRTGEVKEPSIFFMILFCFYWIVSVPIAIRNTRGSDK